MVSSYQRSFIAVSYLSFPKASGSPFQEASRTMLITTKATINICMERTRQRSPWPLPWSLECFWGAGRRSWPPLCKCCWRWGMPICAEMLVEKKHVCRACSFAADAGGIFFPEYPLEFYTNYAFNDAFSCCASVLCGFECSAVKRERFLLVGVWFACQSNHNA